MNGRCEVEPVAHGQADGRERDRQGSQDDAATGGRLARSEREPERDNGAAIGAYRIADATGEAWGQDGWTPFAQSRSTGPLKTRDAVPTMYAASTLPGIVAGLDTPVGADSCVFSSMVN